MKQTRDYTLQIDPKILELLGPSLYTNIYYVLAELIANAYDASASNVYIIQKSNAIIVEDDGTGMSYSSGDITKYLNVAVETRNKPEDILTIEKNRKKMGRKGIGKLAALSVSENVNIYTRKDGEVSAFVLSRHVGSDRKLKQLEEKDVKFEKVERSQNGTSVVMTNPEYGLHKTPDAIKNNLLKIFPLVDKDFRIHIITDQGEITVDSFDREMINGLGALIILGDEYKYLSKYFNSHLMDNNDNELLVVKEAYSKILKIKNKLNTEKDYPLIIKGWIGAYRTTRDRKNDRNDFPDNFISLLSNKKLGEYDILPIVGKNRLSEVYIVGQLHVDLFEETELPDMALSNRQGYKTDDIRYLTVVDYIRDKLLPEIVGLRTKYAVFQRDKRDKNKLAQQEKDEAELRRVVDDYTESVTRDSIEEISAITGGNIDGISQVIKNNINRTLPLLGIKKKVDDQKKRILISHSSSDKILADIIYKMLCFNGVPESDIIYTSSENEESRIPNRMGIYEYLRTFFVDSFSDKKMFVIYVTSNEMAMSWGAVSEVGAGWITQSKHEIFNISGHRPQAPLDVDTEWQTSKIEDDKIIVSVKEADKFVVKIRDICLMLGYGVENKSKNETELLRYITIK